MKECEAEGRNQYVNSFLGNPNLIIYKRKRVLYLESTTIFIIEIDNYRG